MASSSSSFTDPDLGVVDADGLGLENGDPDEGPDAGAAGATGSENNASSSGLIADWSCMSTPPSPRSTPPSIRTPSTPRRGPNPDQTPPKYRKPGVSFITPPRLRRMNHNISPMSSSQSAAGSVVASPVVTATATADISVSVSVANNMVASPGVTTTVEATSAVHSIPFALTTTSGVTLTSSDVAANYDTIATSSPQSVPSSSVASEESSVHGEQQGSRGRGMKRPAAKQSATPCVKAKRPAGK